MLHNYYNLLVWLFPLNFVWLFPLNKSTLALSCMAMPWKKVFHIYIRAHKGATTLQKLGGPNRAKPESSAQSARYSRAKPESRATPEKKREGGVWGSMSPSPENCLEFRNSNRSIWYIVEKGILKKSTFHRQHRKPFQTNELNRPPCYKLCPKLGSQKKFWGSWPPFPRSPLVAPLRAQSINCQQCRINFEYQLG